MSHPYENVVTRPEHFDAEKDYALVIARGDEWFGDYDLLAMQQILRHDLAVILAPLFKEGAILVEAGGTIGTPVPGVNLGSDALGAAGTYTGLESQNYTVTILASGGEDVATYTWRSTGGDNPAFAGEAVAIRAVAPTLTAGLADLATYGHAVGAFGVQVVFVNATGVLTGGNTWVVPVTYGARAPIVSGTTITVADLLVYGGRGKVYRVKGGTLTYPSASSGTSVVYAEAKRVKVDHVVDPTLTDPASERGQGWREAWPMVLRTTDTIDDAPSAGEIERRTFALYRWDRATDVVTKVIPVPFSLDVGKTEGSLSAERLLNVDNNELLRGILARLDAGAHGSGYVVEPLPPAARAAKSTNTPGAGKIRLRFPPIRASVMGVPIVRDLPTELEVDQATDFLTVADEPHTFLTGTNLYKLNKAATLPGFPVKAITKVTAEVNVGVIGVSGYEAVTRGGGSQDTLSKTPVLQIIRISNSQGGAANYASGTDYVLTGNAVDWSPGGSEPAGSATYYVHYRYLKTMVLGVDVQLTSDQADFSPAGDDPVNNTSFQVDYQYYVPRTDTVILRPTGALDILKGLPAEEPVTPTVPLNTLAYCRVEIAANDVNPALRRFPNDAVPMEKLNLVLDALDELTRDLLLVDLRLQAMARAASLSGTPNTAGIIDALVDGFQSTAIADETYNTGGHAFSALIDEERGELTVPFTPTVAALTKTAPPAGETDVRTGSAFYTIPFTHELAIDSSRWSDSHPVNPYSDFSPEPPLVALEPSQDSWVDTSTVTTTATRRIQRGKAKVIARVFTEVATKASETAAVFMRQIAVTIRGFHFLPGEKVRVKFDGKDVPFTAVAPSTQGADSFTVIARASDPTHVYGTVTGTITVPANVPTGTVAVELYGDQAAPGSTWPASYSVRARATYSSEGVQRTEAVEITTVVVRNDPIAQSFLFPEARMISRIDVPLGGIHDDLGPPLIVEVRETDRSGAASTPVDAVLGRISREPPDLFHGVVSSNLFDFTDPIHMAPNEYRALVVRSASNAYRAYVAKLGENDRTGGGFITGQQIPGGIFMDSSNNTDWTLHQGWDLRCKVYVVKCAPLEARLYLNRVSLANMTGFYLAPDQVVPDGTSIEWQYSTDGLALNAGGKVWTTFVPFQVVEFAATTGTLDVRAILRTSNAYVTPAIHTKNLSLLAQVNATAAKYISKAKALSAAQTTIHGSVELATPAGGTQTIVVSANDGANWTNATPTAGQPTADGFNAVAFTATGLTSGTKLRVRIDQSTPNRAQRPRARALTAYAPPV